MTTNGGTTQEVRDDTDDDEDVVCTSVDKLNDIDLTSQMAQWTIAACGKKYGGQELDSMDLV